MPRKLSEEAQEIWRETVAEMASANVLRLIDKRALALFCEMAADWDKSRQPDGKKFTSTEVAQYRMLMCELGMTPASRLRTPPIVEDFEPKSTWQSDELAKAKAEASGKLIRMSTRLSGISKRSTPAASKPADTSV
jgi:phage terminase small subunit